MCYNIDMKKHDDLQNTERDSARQIAQQNALQNAIEENIRCGLIEVLILSMLSHRDMYTYEIKQEILKRSDGRFQILDGSMYGPMYRMMERGLISSRQEVVGKKRFRNYYHLEPAGKEYLAFAVPKFYEIFGIADLILRETKFEEQGAGEE